MWAKLAKNVKPKVKVTATPEPNLELKQLDQEMWLTKKLGQRGVGIFTGDTDRSKRVIRFREAIMAGGLANEIVGKNKAGEAETYRALFARMFGEPL